MLSLTLYYSSSPICRRRGTVQHNCNISHAAARLKLPARYLRIHRPRSFAPMSQNLATTPIYFHTTPTTKRFFFV